MKYKVWSFGTDNVPYFFPTNMFPLCSLCISLNSYSSSTGTLASRDLKSAMYEEAVDIWNTYCMHLLSSTPSLSHRTSLTEHKLKDKMKNFCRATARQLIKCGVLLSIGSHVITLFEGPWSWSCLHVLLSRREEREEKGEEPTSALF